MATSREDSEEDSPSWHFLLSRSERAHTAALTARQEELACAGARLQTAALSE